MRFSSLASGSSGNATLVEGREGERVTRLLVDCGLGPRRLRQALSQRGVTLEDIDAVFVTHEHGDHLGGVFALQRRRPGLTVWASEGTWRSAPAGTTAACVAHDGTALAVGSLEVLPFTVPHDAAEPLQLVVRCGAARLGIVTDLGEPDDGVVRALQGCDALLVECNHDRTMLEQGPYPVWLRRRIGSRRGHLSNDQATALLAACRHDALRHVVAAHLSRHNNEPTRALAALRAALPPHAGGPTLAVADGAAGSAWFDVG